MQNFDLLEIRTLGHVAINWRTKAEPVTLSPREAAFLIYLTYHRVPVHRSHLCHLFWPNEAAQRAQGNLRKLLIDVRKRLGALIVADRESIGLHQDLEYWLDVHEFQWQMQPLGQGNKIASAIKEIDTPRLLRGIHLYGGEFLGNFKLPKSRVFCTWLEQEQQHLHQQVVNALKVLIEGSKDRKQYAEALEYAKRILALDPFEEDAHEQTMLLWAQMGYVEEALQHYQAYCQFLKKELAVAPEPQLTMLYQKIRSGTVTITYNESKAAPVQPTERTSLPLKQLPKPLTPLIGRTETLNQLQRYLTDPAVRLVTLVGMGGVGKSHLALTLVERLALSFDDNIVFVPLHGIQQEVVQGEEGTKEDNRQAKVIDELALATAKALQIPFVTVELALSQLGAYLYDKHLLLIFDGFERLGLGAHFLADLLQEAPLLKALVTSRECLQVPGESVVHLEGLPLPPLEEIQILINSHRGERSNAATAILNYVEVAKQAPSLQLFLQCLQRQTPDISLQSECFYNIIQICQLVEGNPLAIELAAGLSFHYSWREIVDRLQSDLDILRTDQRGRAQRHRSMTSVIEDSWHLLSSQEQATLTGLSIFANRFSRNAALTVTGSTPELLMALVNKSFVRSKGAGHYELPRLIRLFAYKTLSNLVNQEQKCALQAAHAAYYLYYLQQQMDHSQAGDGEAVTVLIQHELGNLLNVCSWIHRHGSPKQRQQYMSLLSALRRRSATTTHDSDYIADYSAARISTIS